MIQLVDSHNLQPNSSIDEEILNNLYSFLRPSVSRLVYFSNIPAFQGQEYDLIQDIIQEAIVKFTFYSQETYVFFPKQMVLVIAKRLFLDTVRKESRIEHSIPEIFPNEKHDFGEEAVDNVYLEQIFLIIAKEIMKFPQRQKLSLLTDIAWRVDVDNQTVPLQSAFLKTGLDLREYRLPLPLDPRRRRAHASNVTHALRRLSEAEAVQKLITDSSVIFHC